MSGRSLTEPWPVVDNPSGPSAVCAAVCVVKLMARGSASVACDLSLCLPMQHSFAAV